MSILWLHRLDQQQRPKVLPTPQGPLGLGASLCSILKNVCKMCCKAHWTRPQVRQSSARSMDAVLACRQPNLVLALTLLGVDLVVA